jgi:hypothetical protein
MEVPSAPSVVRGARSISARLNQECLCITLDRDALCQALERAVGDQDFYATFIGTRPHLFSNAPVFISESETDEMLRIVRAIEAATRLPGYQEAALSWAPEIARPDFGPLGVFMGYDFHLATAGPKLIEVNSNAGGAFLNALLAKAQRACCAEIEVAPGESRPTISTGRCCACSSTNGRYSKGPARRSGSRSSMIVRRNNISIQSFSWPSVSFKSMASTRRLPMEASFTMSTANC